MTIIFWVNFKKKRAGRQADGRHSTLGAGGANDIIYMELTEGDEAPVRTRTADGHFDITNVDVAEQAALLASFNKARAQATVTAGARKVI